MKPLFFCIWPLEKILSVVSFFLANMAMASQPKEGSLRCIKQLQICHLADYPKQHIECSISLYFLKVQAASTGIILKDKANNSEKAVASKTRRRSFTIPVFNFYYVLV